MESAEIVIIGTGFAGLCMAIALKAAGRHDFVLLERAEDVGGTWRDNEYPGCACDIPSLLYSFSFDRGFEWSRDYPTQPEILAYLRRCVRKYGLGPHVRYGVDVAEARYDEPTARWRVTAANGTAFDARVLVSAMGGLSNPSIPELPGIERFSGPSFHSAQWNHAVDLTGKDVAVVGTGASAIQFVPQIAPKAARVLLFQRTPPWVLPKFDGPVSRRERFLRRFVPGYARFRRLTIYWLHEVRALGFTVDPRILARMEKLARAFLRHQVPDPELRRKLEPDYRMGCKRVLLSNDYYPALQRDNVEVVTDPIASVEADAIVTAGGARRHADAIVYATGFRAQEAVGNVRISGAGGRTLADAWRNGMEAFLGVSVAGFPNLFLLVGPNTGLGHNSMVLMIESQVRYVMGALGLMRKRRFASLDVRPDVQRAFNRALERRMKHTVWSTGCRSWYLDANGKNTTLWPGFTFEFRHRTARFDPRRYRTVSARALAKPIAAAAAPRVAGGAANGGGLTL